MRIFVTLNECCKKLLIQIRECIVGNDSGFKIPTKTEIETKSCWGMTNFSSTTFLFKLFQSHPYVTAFEFLQQGYYF